jgi:hypothetical protein
MDKPEILVTRPVGKDLESNENYQLVNLLRRLHVSEQKPDALGGDLTTGSIDPVPDATGALAAAHQELKQEPTSLELKLRKLKTRELKLRELKPQETASQKPALDSVTVESESPKLVPDPGGSAEAAKDAPEVEAVKADAPPPTGDIKTMPPSGDDPCDDSYSNGGSWSGEAGETASDPDLQTPSISGKRRIAALAAVIALAVVSGAVGGALATAGLAKHLGQSSGSDATQTASVPSQAVEESIARIDAEVASLKQLSAAQSAKVNDRIDKVEKVQAEPAAKLAKLSEAVEKLHAPAVAPVAVAAIAAPKETAPKEAAAKETASKETTGSIQSPAATPKPKPEIARLPTIEGWVLRDVDGGGALIEGRQGLFEVFAGDTMPGLGRVEAIRRQDGRWVVVTNKGLIVTR